MKDFDESNQQEVDISNNQSTENIGSTFTNTSKEKPKQHSYNKETESIQVEHLSREEIIKMLGDLQIVINTKKSTANLKFVLKKKLELKNPINDFLKTLKPPALKDIVKKIKIEYDQSHAVKGKEYQNNF